jgi:hypothetical protein
MWGANLMLYTDYFSHGNVIPSQSDSFYTLLYLEANIYIYSK